MDGETPSEILLGLVANRNRSLIAALFVELLCGLVIVVVLLLVVLVIYWDCCCYYYDLFNEFKVFPRGIGLFEGSTPILLLLLPLNEAYDTEEELRTSGFLEADE